MSEYQYYGFLALDQPLTKEQRAALRSISSRAERRREEEARKAAAQAAARAKRLDQLATRTEAAWEKVAEWIETRRPSDYDLAVSQLQDLKALAERDGNPEAFSQRFGELRLSTHASHPCRSDSTGQA